MPTDNALLDDTVGACLRVQGSVSASNGAASGALRAMARVTRVSGDFAIRDTSLVILDGLERLERVDGELSIRENGQLTSLEALEALHTVGSLDIRDNPVLPSGDVSALEARVTETSPDSSE